MTNILVTGGAGFIGSHLVDRLLTTDGNVITVVDDFNDFYSPDIKRANIAGHLGNKRYTLVEADIRDRAALDQLFDKQQFDCVVHLAARAGVRPSLSEPVLYAETNVDGTLHLLELARSTGVNKEGEIVAEFFVTWSFKARSKSKSRMKIAFHGAARTVP